MLLGPLLSTGSTFQTSSFLLFVTLMINHDGTWRPRCTLVWEWRSGLKELLSTVEISHRFLCVWQRGFFRQQGPRVWSRQIYYTLSWLTTVPPFVMELQQTLHRPRPDPLVKHYCRWNLCYSHLDSRFDNSRMSSNKHRWFFCLSLRQG